MADYVYVQVKIMQCSKNGGWLRLCTIPMLPVAFESGVDLGSAGRAGHTECRTVRRCVPAGAHLVCRVGVIVEASCMLQLPQALR